MQVKKAFVWLSVQLNEKWVLKRKSSTLSFWLQKSFTKSASHAIRNRSVLRASLSRSFIWLQKYQVQHNTLPISFLWHVIYFNLALHQPAFLVQRVLSLLQFGESQLRILVRAWIFFLSDVDSSVPSFSLFHVFIFRIMACPEGRLRKCKILDKKFQGALGTLAQCDSKTKIIRIIDDVRFE